MYSKAKPRNTKLRKKNKVHLVFDETKRRDFLTGFHKRKMERKKKAKEKFEKDLKEEKRRLKAEARESYKKLVKSYTPIPELEHLLTKEYEDEDVNVKIVELSTNELTKTNDWIGANQPHYESEDDQKSELEGEEKELLPGMELNSQSVKKEEVENIENNDDVKSNKDIKKLLKKQATKNVQKSKMFQKKNKIEKRKQKLQSKQQKKIKMKHQKNDGKKKNIKK